MSEYWQPNSLEDALTLLAAAPGRRLLAGGTDLYPAVSGSTLTGPVVDLSALRDLRGIHQDEQGLRIGAGVTWSDLMAADLPPALRGLQMAAGLVGGVQIQNAGTLVGNLCNASPAADGVPPLLVLDASVTLASAGATRRLALAEFLTGPRQTALRAGEMMTEITIPQAALAGQSHFLKLGARAYLVISIVMVAVRVRIADGHIADAALAVGSCSATARRLPVVEAALIGVAPERAAAAIRTETVASALAPLDDLRATAAYRVEAAAELLRRAVQGALA